MILRLRIELHLGFRFVFSNIFALYMYKLECLLVTIYKMVAIGTLTNNVVYKAIYDIFMNFFAWR